MPEGCPSPAGSWATEGWYKAVFEAKQGSAPDVELVQRGLVPGHVPVQAHAEPGEAGVPVQEFLRLRLGVFEDPPLQTLDCAVDGRVLGKVPQGPPRRDQDVLEDETE